MLMFMICYCYEYGVFLTCMCFVESNRSGHVCWLLYGVCMDQYVSDVDDYDLLLL